MIEIEPFLKIERNGKTVIAAMQESLIAIWKSRIEIMSFAKKLPNLRLE